MLDTTYLYHLPTADIPVTGFIAYLLQLGDAWDIRCLEADMREYHASGLSFCSRHAFSSASHSGEPFTNWLYALEAAPNRKVHSFSALDCGFFHHSFYSRAYYFTKIMLIE